MTARRAAGPRRRPQRPALAGRALAVDVHAAADGLPALTAELVDAAGRVHGRLEARRAEAYELRDGCYDDAVALGARLDLEGAVEVLVVVDVAVAPRYRGRGWGAALYLAAARYAAEEFGAALAPDLCRGGGTSEAAWRVWRGRRLGTAVMRQGRLVYGGRGADGSS